VRVAVYAPFFPPFEGGAERVAARVAAELGRRHEVRVFTHRHDEGLPDEAVVDGVSVARLPMRFRRAAGFTDLASPALARALDRWRYDVLHVHGVAFPSVALRALWHARRRGRPSLVVGHGLYEALCPPGSRQGTGRVAYWLAIRALLGVLLAAATHVVASSEIDRPHLRGLGVRARRITVIPNGVDLPVVDPAVGAAFRARHDLRGRAVLLHVGNVKPGKGHDTVTRALPEIVAGAPETAYVAVGGVNELWRGYADGIQREWCRPELAGSVRYLGHVSDAELTGAYVAADVVLMASSQETLPLALLDAMAYRKPAVATAVGGVPTLIQDERNGLLVPPDDPPALARAALRLLRDPEARDRLGAEARATVETEYTWPVIGLRYEELSRRLLAAARR
jgi:D-inositol-3-phosphate glycosyltransferase